MIETLNLAGIEIYLTRFTPEETGRGQMEAQKSAVSRLLTAIAGEKHQLCHH